MRGFSRRNMSVGAFIAAAALADNVFLSSNPGDTIRAYITGGVDECSSVGVRTKASGDRMVGKDISTYAFGAYSMDLSSFYVTHGTDHNGDLWQRVSEK